MEAARAALRVLADESEEKLADLAFLATREEDLTGVRKVFVGLSEYVVDNVEGNDRLMVAFCPMGAANRGARLIQREGEIRNPYIGSSMLECGERVEEK